MIKPLVCILTLIIPQGVYCEVRMIQKVDFGIVAVASNTVSSSVTINRFGSQRVGEGFRLVSAGEPGRFIVENMLPQVTYNVQISIVNSTMIASQTTNESFVFDILDYDQIITTDVDGNAFIRIGGQITKSGNGNLEFTQTDYQSLFNITINQ